MPLVGAPIVEALAVMGFVHPFFEKSGMKVYRGPESKRCAQMKEAMSLVGIEEEKLIDAEAVQEKIELLGKKERDFIDFQMREFLRGYGKRRMENDGYERTRFILSKINIRPVYYIWFNDNMSLRSNKYQAPKAKQILNPNVQIEKT
jgi:hypothetical protein